MHWQNNENLSHSYKLHRHSYEIEQRQPTNHVNNHINAVFTMTISHIRRSLHRSPKGNQIPSELEWKNEPSRQLAPISEESAIYSLSNQDNNKQTTSCDIWHVDWQCSISATHSYRSLLHEWLHHTVHILTRIQNDTKLFAIRKNATETSAIVACSVRQLGL